MDVRILVFRLSGDRVQVSVIDPVHDRVWRKMYSSTHECVADLHRIGLYTSAEPDKALKTDADNSDRMLVGQGITAVDVLERAAFAEFVRPETELKPGFIFQQGKKDKS